MLPSPTAKAPDVTPTATAARGGEIRLSFGYFYVVLKWGKERRSSERVDQDRKNYPVLTSTHLPVLVGVWTALIVLLYSIVVMSLEALIALVA